MTPLNKAASIATILGTVVAVISLFLAQNSQPVAAASNGSSPQPAKVELDTPSPRIDKIDVHPQESETHLTSSDIDNATLEEKFRVALLISSTFTKDQKLHELAGLAASSGLFDKAIEISKEISSTFTKDGSLNNIVTKALEQNNKKAALDAAGGISSTFTRDTVYSKISSQ